MLYRDHPRMRGEQFYSCVPFLCHPGSPPHARGADWRWRRMIVESGITPACAGSSRQKDLCRSSGRDHPRMRGEQTKKVQSYKGFFVFFYQISFNF